jgi:hypothetical protein
MKIETKFNIGDDVFRIYNSKIVIYEIYNINIKVYKNCYHSVGVKIKYELLGRPNVLVEEEELFATKQELLDSL